MGNKMKNEPATESLLVRPADIADLGQLAELNLQLLAKAGHSLSEGNYEALRHAFIDRTVDTLYKPDETGPKTLIAVNGADIINGFVEYEYAENYMEITSMYAHEKNRKIGTQLVSQVVSEARQKKINQIYVEAFDDVVGFYQKMGFTEINPDPEKRLIPMCLVLQGSI
jgi:GNAT superfamily N-acetyltransferase